MRHDNAGAVGEITLQRLDQSLLLSTVHAPHSNPLALRTNT
jgi:hypothetical protein